MPIDIDSVVTEYVDRMKASMDTYGDLARNAGARLTDAEPPATTWTEDIVKFWETAAQDLVQLVATQQKFAAEAAKK